MSKSKSTIFLILTIFALIGCIGEILTSEDQIEPKVTSITDFSLTKSDKVIDEVIVNEESYYVIWGEPATLVFDYEYELVESTKVGVTDNDVEILKIKDVENNNTIYVASRGDSISISVIKNT